MKKLRRLLFKLIMLAMVASILIFTFNTMRFSSKQVNVEKVEPMAIDEHAIDRLAEAIRIPTLSYEDHVDTLAFRHLDTFLWSSYSLVDSMLEKEVVNQFSYILKWPGQNVRLTPILLMAHMDVVGVEGEGANWSVAPFDGVQKDGFLWGRGALDDKLAVCGILEAIESLLAVDYAPQRTVYLAFGHDEEVGGEHGAKEIASIFRRRNIEFEFIVDEGGLVVENALPGCDPPVALIGLSEKGYVTVDLTADVESGGHSSMPGYDSAINLLSEAIVQLRNRPPPAKIEGPVKAMFDHIGPEMNLFNKILFANLRWTQNLVIGQMSKSPSTNATIRTSIAPTIINAGFKDNVIPPTQATAKVNCRILPGESVETTLEYIRSVIDERIEASLGPDSQASEPPPISSMETFGYSILQTTAREVFHEAIVAPFLVVGTTDARHYVEVSDNIYRFLPVKVTKPQIGSIHGVDERIAVEAYEQTIRFYRQLVLNACK